MSHKLIGLKVKAVRRMTKKEMRSEGWDCKDPPKVIIFADGTKVFPSIDPEANGPGILFGTTSDGDKIYV